MHKLLLNIGLVKSTNFNGVKDGETVTPEMAVKALFKAFERVEQVEYVAASETCEDMIIARVSGGDKEKMFYSIFRWLAI